MGFSKEWDERYKELTQLSIWPWSDLVSYVLRYSRPAKKGFKVLEIGCGAGANIPFFRALGCEYYAVEGSVTIVKQLKRKFPALKTRLAVADFTQSIPFKGKFDLIVDRAALTHNRTADIKSTVALIRDRLRKKGLFIGIDWFSTTHSDFGGGTAKVDDFTFSGYGEGPFANLGHVHFSDKTHLEKLFSGFELEIMEHKTIRREKPQAGYTLATWNFVARKK